jgi:hypothetical protein
MFLSDVAVGSFRVPSVVRDQYFSVLRGSRLGNESAVSSPHLCTRKNDALFVAGTETQIIPLVLT